MAIQKATRLSLSAAMVTAVAATVLSFIWESPDHAVGNEVTTSDQATPLARLRATAPSPLPPSWQPSAASVSLTVDGSWSWALRNRETDEVIGSGGNFRNTTESMIKAWLAVDYLASKKSSISSADANLIHDMIHVSDDQAAQTLYLRLGGDVSVRRMIDRCGLTSTTVHHNWWSKTTMSAEDATTLGVCVASGPGITPEWRDRLLSEMQNLSPSNNFGIAEAPALQGRALAVKNGWTLHGTTWAVNCLAVWDKWSLAVMVRFEDRPGGHRYGATVCAGVADQLFRDQP